MEVRQWDINCKINLINIKLFSKLLEFNDKDACWREYSTSYQTRSIYSYPLPDTVHVSRNARGRKQMNICRSYVIRSAHVFFHHPDINPSGGDQLTSTGILGRPSRTVWLSLQQVRQQQMIRTSKFTDFGFWLEWISNLSRVHELGLCTLGWILKRAGWSPSIAGW